MKKSKDKDPKDEGMKESKEPTKWTEGFKYRGNEKMHEPFKLKSVGNQGPGQRSRIIKRQVVC